MAGGGLGYGPASRHYDENASPIVCHRKNTPTTSKAKEPLPQGPTDDTLRIRASSFPMNRRGKAYPCRASARAALNGNPSAGEPTNYIGYKGLRLKRKGDFLTRRAQKILNIAVWQGIITGARQLKRQDMGEDQSPTSLCRRIGLPHSSIKPRLTSLYPVAPDFTRGNVRIIAGCALFAV